MLGCAAEGCPAGGGGGCAYSGGGCAYPGKLCPPYPSNPCGDGGGNAIDIGGGEVAKGHPRHRYRLLGRRSDRRGCEALHRLPHDKVCGRRGHANLLRPRTPSGAVRHPTPAKDFRVLDCSCASAQPADTPKLSNNLLHRGQWCRRVKPHKTPTH